MKLRNVLSARTATIGSAVLIVGLSVGGFFLLRRPTRIPMERYVPAGALAFLEIDSVSDLADGLTGTTAWRELAPVLGLSSQIRQVGFLADLVGRTGLGPDEAVIIGRAQLALAITGIESQTGETEDGPYIHLKPDFAVIIESHLSPSAAARLVRERAPVLAERVYGESIEAETQDHGGSELLIFRGPGSGHQLIASSAGSVMIIANKIEAMQACLDSIEGRLPSIAGETTLVQMRPEVDHDAAVFGYVTAQGIRKLFEIWPGLLAGRSAAPETANSFADLLQHISDQAAVGLLYSSEFKDRGVTERYLTALRPEIAEALASPLKPASGASFRLLNSIPEGIERLTLLDAPRAGELPERLLKQLSPNLDVVAGVALREFVINLRKQYALEPSDSLGDSAGDEIAFVNLGDQGPLAMLMIANDKARLLPLVTRYLARKGATVTTEVVQGTETMVSSDEDRRGAAFVGDTLVLATRDQIAKLLSARSAGETIDKDEYLKRILAARPSNSSVVSYRPGVDDAALLMLALSKLTRVTDGSPELLKQDSARKAMDRFPRSVSFTEFRDDGVYVEARSAVGSYSLIGSLVKTGEE